MSFEPERVFEALEREGVRYVVIGGVGAVLCARRAIVIAQIAAS